MKKILALVLFCLTVSSVFAQSTDRFNYQAVVRNTDGSVIANRQVDVRVSILQGGTSGASIYVESFSQATNGYGLINLSIGTSNKQAFESISWGNGPYFIKVEIDINGGSNYVTMGTSQLLSVPYALYAKTAGSMEETDPVFNLHPAKDITSNEIYQWNAAYGWGDHSAAGYLKSYSETDPVFSIHPAKNITNGDISNWNEVYSWGNHANAGYLKSYSETDPLFSVHPSRGITADNISDWNNSYSWGNHADAGYLKSYTETDPIFAVHPSSSITSSNISSWNLAYSWGNHADAGYLKSYTETDPVFMAHPSSGITSSNIANWNEAYSWGNHQGLYRPISYVPSWGEVTDKPSFSTVATTGSYNDLTNKPAGASVGDMQYWDGSKWVNVPVGQPGQYLQLNSSGVPAWSGAAYATVSTVSVNSVTYTSAVSGGNIASDGGATVTERGVCWSITANPTIVDTKTSDGSGSGVYSSTVSGLTSGLTYHIRAYATNSAGTTYGNDISFTTKTELASVTTSSASSITSISAVCGGNVISSGGGSVIERGVCWSTSASPTIANSKVSSGTGTGSFTCNVSGLSAGTTYYVRAYATNAGGTAYGTDQTFTTDAIVAVDNSHLLLGNPSGATADVANENDYLMEKTQYSLSYNNSKLTPNWTSWHLYSGDIGSTDRQDNFRADSDLPSGWYHVGSSDYQYSTYGFDRGHMCPSADRTASVEDNSATFLMDNMIPQAPNNNQQTWGNLENYCRSLVDAGNELYIISGPYGQGGSSAKGTFNTISVNSGANFITVPSKTWKIIVVLTNGDNDLSRITTSTRVIAVVMPNDQTCNSKQWYEYRVSVDSLESLTGYDFLSNVSTAIQSVIEASVDNVAI
ncbi:MAG: DNA/RNA non-specific endonuclease [Bacteroidales bacterium]